MSDLNNFFEELVYHTAEGERRGRFTQQSPVMPDVWIQYGMNPGKQQDLLMEPNWHHTTIRLKQGLVERLELDEETSFDPGEFRDAEGTDAEAVAHNQNVVAARLFFDQLVRSVLPLSGWWKRRIAGIEGRDDEDRLAERLRTDRDGLLEQLTFAVSGQTGPDGPGGALDRDQAWLARVGGLIAYLSSVKGREEWRKLGPQIQDDRSPTAREEASAEENRFYYVRELVRHRPRDLADAILRLLEDIPEVFEADDYPLYTVNRNRETSLALNDSVASVKADAVRNVFEVSGQEVRWAVIDSGIDALHPAFRQIQDGQAFPEAFSAQEVKTRSAAEGKHTKYRNQTRIRATFDFVNIRELLGTKPRKSAVRKLAEKTVKGSDRLMFPALQDENKREELLTLLKGFRDHVVDWQRLEPYLSVQHDPSPPPQGYRQPRNPHGTHVAGIIGANWQSKHWSDDQSERRPHGRDLQGICPDIELYDLRVLDDEGVGNEFAIMSAMQFVRDLNNRRDFVAIHGVNLSFSIQHDVANYACGRTPVCDEAERLVGNGTVVVAAAGNSGRARYLTPSNTVDDGFRTVSITDPGNADKVITVGSTHRRDAHTYGVSYFSSRGPTGDGRLKPDLVAPGEKIRSTVPGGGEDRLDGTSMAAPHVSGAAALILARHSEFIGQPERVKQILCDAATDLGREPYFQGAGLLDILRALESI